MKLLEFQHVGTYHGSNYLFSLLVDKNLSISEETKVRKKSI